MVAWVLAALGAVSQLVVVFDMRDRLASRSFLSTEWDPEFADVFVLRSVLR